MEDQGQGQMRRTTTDARTVAFLGHGAERTGPPILLGHLLRGVREQRPWRLSVLLDRAGPLEAEYRLYADQVVAIGRGREPLEPLGAALRRLGVPRRAEQIHAHRRSQMARRIGSPDLIYINAATPPTAALVHALTPARVVPVVLHVHEMDVGLRTILSDDDRQMLLGRADHVIAASGAVANVLTTGHGVSADALTVCDEFIDIEAVDPLSRAEARRRLDVPLDAKVVGSVGLPDWRKDPDHLLRAIHHLGSEAGEPPWVVWIGGLQGSADAGHLLDEARRLGLGQRFRHVPHCADPSQFLHALDVFALPAREDALPLAALEAAAAGLPLVCFRTGGIASLCDSGAGIAVDYPDTGAFAAAIGTLLRDEQRRDAAGGQARAIVASHHGIEVGTSRIIAVLDEILQREGAALRAPSPDAASDAT